MIINANALHIPLADKTVQTVVTSPPYWGLRDYGTAKWDGGDPECDHKQTTARHDGGRENINGFHGSAAVDSDKGAINYRDICGKCGARRLDAQLGLEPTPDEYVANMVAVFREVWRVMRKDGVCWLNLGDSYAGSPGNGRGGETVDGGLPHRSGKDKAGYGLKPKDLCGIPWRVAFALQADGWWLRSDIIWHKPNPMPESVTDRPTKAHEYIFLLTKAANYYYDAEAVKENSTDDEYRTVGKIRPTKDPMWENSTAGDNRGGLHNQPGGRTTRNRRTVWTIPTSPYSGSHFATFPPDLVRPCILAGSSPRACEHCGAPWERVVERESHYEKRQERGAPDWKGSQVDSSGWRPPTVKDTGWRPTCACDNAGTGRCIVLDPFAGTFTVGMVAAEYGRRAVGIELNPEYIKLARERTAQAMAQQVMPL